MHFKGRLKAAIYAILFFVLIAFDQFTKYIATINLKDSEPFVIIKNVFEFNYLDGGNRGAAWGILSGKINFFIVLTIFICIFIIFTILRIEKRMADNSPTKKRLNFLQIIFVVLLSGAVGNLIDRIANGYVVDFIYFKLIDFPIFNVADCYVTVSAVLILITCIFFISEEEFSQIFYIKFKSQTDK